MKYTDDSVIAGLISDNNESTYRNRIFDIKLWSENHNLNLNVSKTKEVLFYIRKTSCHISSIFIDNVPLKCVDSYEYLGCIIDSKLTFSEHVENQTKTANNCIS